MAQLVTKKNGTPVSSGASADSDPANRHASEHSSASVRAEKREALLAEMASVRKEGEILEQRVQILTAAEKTTGFVRDASLVVGSGVATVVAGPAGGAAFRAGVGVVSHGAEAVVAASVGTFHGDTLKRQLTGDVVEGAVTLVGGKAAMGAASAAAHAMGKSGVSAATSGLVAAQAAGVSAATVQNAQVLGEKIVEGEHLGSRDAKQVALNYAAAVVTAGVSTKVPLSSVVSARNVGETAVTMAVAAGQQYALDGRVSLDSTLLAGLQNATMAGAVAKHSASQPVGARVSQKDSHKERSPSLTVHGSSEEGVRTALEREVSSWREKGESWSPLQKWIVEEAERHHIEAHIVEKKEGTRHPQRVEVELASTYGSGEEAFLVARREMFLKVGELHTGKPFVLSSPAAVYLHRLCEELSVTTSDLGRARHEMFRRHGSDLVEMGLSEYLVPGSLPVNSFQLYDVLRGYLRKRGCDLGRRMYPVNVVSLTVVCPEMRRNVGE